MSKRKAKTQDKHELRIIFDGVIAVGPPPPKRGKKLKGPFFGVMARSNRQLSDRSLRLKEKRPKFIPMHVPTVYTTMAPAKDSRPPDEVFQMSVVHPTWYIWHPQRERMEFRFDGSGNVGDLTYNDGSKNGLAEPFQVSIHDIAMVPDARQICPERADLLDGLLTAPSADAPVREEAAAQILLPWGTVLAGGIFDKADGVEVVFDPPRVSDEPTTVVPNVVVSVDAAYVEIAMYSLDTGERLDSLRFEVIEDAELWISNGDPSDTAIDLDKLSKVIGKAEIARNPSVLSNHLSENFGKVLNLKAGSKELKGLMELFSSGGGIVSPDIAAKQPVRSSEFDIDFELFYSIADGSDDGKGLSIPRKADGKPFDGPNCLCQMMNCRERLHLLSNRR